MLFADFAREIRKLGREIDVPTLQATRKLVGGLIAEPPGVGVRIVRDVRYGDHERRRLDIFTPLSGSEPERPVLIYVHGGGFVAGDKYTPGSPFYDNVACWAVANGCNAVNITYRLAPQHQWPSGIEDIAAVVRFIRAQGGNRGLSARKLFLMGQSAGAAHAAAYVARPEVYAPEPHGLSGLILLSGIYDFRELRGPMEEAYLGSDTSLYAERSSLTGLVASELPMLITLAENDPPMFERQALELLAALQRKRGQMPRFVHVIGQNHLSVAMYLGLPGDLLAPQLLAFIREHA